MLNGRIVFLQQKQRKRRYKTNNRHKWFLMSESYSPSGHIPSACFLLTPFIWRQNLWAAFVYAYGSVWDGSGCIWVCVSGLGWWLLSVSDSRNSRLHGVYWCLWPSYRAKTVHHTYFSAVSIFFLDSSRYCSALPENVFEAQSINSLNELYSSVINRQDTM